MKGLHHSVIEIKDTENSNIEKIIVFLKPQRAHIDVETTRKEAQEILQKVRIRDRLSLPVIQPRIIALVLSMIVSLATLLIVIF